ncbi:uncharacterized protein MONBRDRAFT_29976 [Monosiga brevicollis MX1]|uniref:Uncharacterized protein n=1 Tax=Monosiga brevicollis TaxID=81824 RepID=A9VCN2_MONBE|nr:uncharacterized protein MONBRDRAFT_29976 [Monosiga brevicollis MX1]EDQ84715.1 predicted protein [Monosiga brevicollis MX1]|eukprot:XP_001750501.1 hypothetical protein [Monosiga brevicollis MX1]
MQSTDFIQSTDLDAIGAAAGALSIISEVQNTDIGPLDDFVGKHLGSSHQVVDDEIFDGFGDSDTDAGRPYCRAKTHLWSPLCSLYQRRSESVSSFGSTNNNASIVVTRRRSSSGAETRRRQLKRRSSSLSGLKHDVVSELNSSRQTPSSLDYRLPKKVEDYECLLDPEIILQACHDNATCPSLGLAAQVSTPNENTPTELIERIAAAPSLNKVIKRRSKPSRKSTKTTHPMRDRESTSSFQVIDELIEFVESTTVPLDEVDHLGRTAIFMAAEKNLADVIHALAKRGASVNKANTLALLISGRCNINLRVAEGAETALIHALLFKSSYDLHASIKVLTPFCPDLNVRMEDGMHAIKAAVLRHVRANDTLALLLTSTSLPAVQGSILNEPVEIKTKSKTPVYWFFDAKSYDATFGLLQLGADPSERAADTDPMLHRAISARRLDIVLMLLEAASSYKNSGLRHEANRLGFHPLIWTCLDLDPLFVRTVVSAYTRLGEEIVDVRVPDVPKFPKGESHMSPNNSLLMELTRRGFVEAAFVLRDYYREQEIPFVQTASEEPTAREVNINEQDGLGRSLVWHAGCRFYRWSRVALLEWLLDEGADVHLADAEGVTPYMAAARNNNVEGLFRLVNVPCRYDANVQWQPPAHRSTPLTTEQVNSRDGRGRTMLWYACLHQNVIMVHYLLRYCAADPNIKCDKGRTCIFLATRNVKRGNWPLVKLLHNCGAHLDVRDSKGLHLADYAFMTEFEYEDRPMVDLLLANDAFNPCLAVSALIAVETAHEDDYAAAWDGIKHGFWSAMGIILPGTGPLWDKWCRTDRPLFNAYAVACAKVPYAKYRILDRAEAMYEGHGDLLASERKAKAATAGMKFSAFLLKMGLSGAMSMAGVGDIGLDGALGGLLDSALDAAFELMGEYGETLSEAWNTFQELGGEDAIQAILGGSRRHNPSAHSASGWFGEAAVSQTFKGGKYEKEIKTLKEPKVKKTELRKLRIGERIYDPATGDTLYVCDTYRQDKKRRYLTATMKLAALCTQPMELSWGIVIEDKRVQSLDVDAPKPRGLLKFSARLFPEQEKLVVTVHEATEVKASKKSPFVVARFLYTRPVDKRAKQIKGKDMRTEVDPEKKWEHTFTYFGIAPDVVQQDYLLLDLRNGNARKPVGSVAIPLKELALTEFTEVVLALEREADFGEDEEDANDDDLPDNTSSYAFMPKLQQDLIDIVDSRFEQGPGEFGGCLPPSLPTVTELQLPVPAQYEELWLKTYNKKLARYQARLEQVIATYAKEHIKRVEQKFLKDGKYTEKALIKRQQRYRNQMSKARNNAVKKSGLVLSQSTADDQTRREEEMASSRISDEVKLRQYLAASTAARLHTACLLALHQHVLKLSRKLSGITHRLVEQV